MEGSENEGILNNQGAIIAYSLPGTTEFINATVGTIVIADATSKVEDYDWIFSPFDKTRNKRLLFKITSYAASRKFSCLPTHILNEEETSKADYTRQFQMTKKLLESGKFKKLVLAKTKHFYIENIDLYPAFLALKNLYPSAFTYLVHIPNFGTWIGASPEQLLSEAADECYLTRAIAGTLPLDDDGSFPHWTPKEIEEHRYIETYLDTALQSLDVEYNIAKSTSLKAGRIAHLCSDISIAKKNTIELLELLDILHPGPALSGLPKKESVEALAHIESIDRSYYSGFLGPLKGEQGLALFANIRCAEVFSNGYKLFVGGGITLSSELEKEWEETELKSETILESLKTTHKLRQENLA